MDPPFLTSALDGGERSASHPGRISPWERLPGAHWIEDWVGPSAGLYDMEERKTFPLLGIEHRPSSP
jgi:hypothetical protein